MQQGDQGEIVRGVVFPLPENLAFVGQRISYGAEAALEKHRESLVFRFLGFRAQRVKRQHRTLDSLRIWGSLLLGAPASCRHYARRQEGLSLEGKSPRRMQAPKPAGCRRSQ